MRESREIQIPKSYILNNDAEVAHLVEHNPAASGTKVKGKKIKIKVLIT